MAAIENREDVFKLVNTFYAKVRTDELLGPIFHRFIAKDDWPAHINKLTDFWETQLFQIPKFRGNPTLKHWMVDQSEPKGISETHFHRWLSLWFETLDAMYEDEKANRAKQRAQQMAVGQFSQIMRFREAAE